MFVCFFSSLSSCYEKATAAQYFGRIRTRLGVVHFRFFRLFLWLFTTNLLLFRSHQIEIIIIKRLIQGRDNALDEGRSWSYDCDHMIAIKMALLPSWQQTVCEASDYLFFVSIMLLLKITCHASQGIYNAVTPMHWCWIYGF